MTILQLADSDNCIRTNWIHNDCLMTLTINFWVQNFQTN